MLIFKNDSHKYRLYVYKLVDSFQENPQSFLSTEEMDHLQHISNDKRRTEYLQSRHALKKLLSQEIGISPEKIQFKKIGEGKPVLADVSFKLDFNLSHSHEVFAIALSDKGSVGVDVEKERSPQHLEQIATRFFSPRETELVRQEKNIERKIEIFVRIWSGKEALIKTVGGGVFKNVHDIVIDENSWKIKSLPSEFGSLSLWNLDYYNNVPGYACSVGFKDSN